MHRTRTLLCLLIGGALAATILLAISPEPALARSSGERPLPAFQGYSLESKLISISDFIGKRLVVFFFNPETDEGKIAAAAVRAVASESGAHNFAVVGVAVGSSRQITKGFASEHKLEFPIIDDSPAIITRQLGLRSPVTILIADAEGYMTFGISQFDTRQDDASETVEDQLRKVLRLPDRDAEDALLGFGGRPKAPLFEGLRLDGGDEFELSTLAGKPLVLIFFLHTCPHCHHALEFLTEQLAKMPAATRPKLVGVSLLDRPGALREMLEEMDLELDEVLLDPSRELQTLYGATTGVPDIFFVDKNRRIVHRVQGWRDKRDPALARMVLAKMAGERIPMLLNPKGYTGSDVCGICHELEHESWQYTAHASAYDTLVTHGKERDSECVGCHVVGFEAPGGFEIDERPPHLENVSCESCHGRGGPHLSKGFVTKGNYEPVCQTCHNPEHSLGFEYASFQPLISHTRIAALTSEERAKLGHARPGTLLSTSASHVGSDACKSCHEAEFATWQTSPHARAIKTLERKGEATNPECQKCHTTGFGLAGGFPGKAEPDAGAESHADSLNDSSNDSINDLARVGCESCHGPGGDHIAADAKKIGTILSLGDKCDSCVILKICGSCHDEANDPGFEFEVVDKIERQRHGTIEAGTGKPLEAADAAWLRPEQALAHVFGHLDTEVPASAAGR